ncbi:hypothetical protein [Clostridium tagluense]|uniref:DUF5659 domain-containing protein n=1 Tax=Clostridium tagluense TaxID=360422 RepID=A0A401UT88_9CLOT|nr:hypothetical protein [Clostridium tagluense]GCD12721.1 hypothetical protein Ctaglu_43440 [Clostridium tagluense]
MYVVKNKRQREYLYNLGFNYSKSQDIYNPSQEIYLFEKSDLLMESITFYSHIKNKQINKI